MQISFQTRAQLADSDVWNVIVRQIGTLQEPKDIEAVLVGATTALTRAFYSVTDKPEPGKTVTVISCIVKEAAEALTKVSEQPQELPPG
jgi:hypothetical protein